MNKAGLLKIIDETLGPVCCRVLSHPQMEDAYPEPERRLRSVLVIRPGGIGDAVMLLPALFALRNHAPEAEIEVLCESRNSGVFKLAFPEMPVYEYDTAPFAALRRLRNSKYSAVVDTEQFHHFSGVMAALAKAPVRVGFKINTRRNALYTHLVSYDLDGPEDRQFLRLFSALTDSQLMPPARFGILSDAVLPALPEAASALLPKGEKLIVMHIGGSAECKRWSPLKYAELGARLERELGLKPVLVGGPDEGTLAEKVLNSGRGGMVNLCGRLSISQTAALCREAGLFAGPDSGIAHLACAAGARCTVLFGPSDSVKWGPDGNGAVVRGNVPCGPCAIFGYNKPCRAHLCMKKISVDEVFSNVKKFVSGK